MSVSDALSLLHENSSPSELHQLLQHLQETSEQPISLYPFQITFRDAKQKREWLEVYHEMEEYASTIFQFLRHPLNGNLVRAGYFLTINDSRVGRTSDYPYIGHAWAAIITRQPGRYGKILIFWDPDGSWRRQNLTPDYATLTTAAQKTLVRELGGRTRLQEIWYGGKGNEKEGILCVQLSMRFVRGLMARGVPEDLEASGYLRIS